MAAFFTLGLVALADRTDRHRSSDPELVNFTSSAIGIVVGSGEDFRRRRRRRSSPGASPRITGFSTFFTSCIGGVALLGVFMVCLFLKETALQEGPRPFPGPVPASV